MGSLFRSGHLQAIALAVLVTAQVRAVRLTLKSSRQEADMADVEPWLETDPNTEDGALVEGKVIFFDYDSTLNPGQNNNPIPEHRIQLLKGFLEAWKAENKHLAVYVHTASSVDAKRKGLQDAGLADLFTDVFSSGIGPMKAKSKGAFLVRTLRDHPDWLKSNILHVDDSISAIASIMGGGVEEGGSSLCHTLRLPQHGDGLSLYDMLWIRDHFLHRTMAKRGLGNFMHAHSFYLSSSDHVTDAYDTPAKCMYDELPEKDRTEMFQSCVKDGRIIVEAFKDLCRGRPDYAASAGVSVDDC